MTGNWRLEPFDARHAPLIELTGQARSALRGVLARGQGREDRPLAFGQALELQAGRMAGAGPAWSLLRGGRVLACGGAVRFWPGVGELWLWLGREALENPVALARWARRALRLLRKRQGFVRLQAHVRADDATARRFAEFLGLRREGLCPGYGPDHATHQLYGRFWEWKA